MKSLAKDPSLTPYQAWFYVLEKLYRAGTGMKEATRGFASQLRREEFQDLDSHFGSLSQKTNLFILFFFFPPAMLLLLLPLLFSIFYPTN